MGPIGKIYNYVVYIYSLANYYYLFYLLPNSVPFLGPYRLIPSIYRKNP